MFSTGIAYVALAASSGFILLVIVVAIHEAMDPLRDLRALMNRSLGVRRRTYWTPKLALAMLTFIVSGIYLFG